MNSTIEVNFAHTNIVLDAAGALYWPTQRLLCVSDLHFEKSTFLSHFGSAIAPYDTLDTLDRLDQLIAHYTPRHLVLLGDSFHDRNAWNRLDDTLRERIISLAQRVEYCHWIEGNHDAHLTPENLPQFLATQCVDGICFTHDYMPGIFPQIIGHYHPSVSFSLNRQKIRGRCFVISDELLIMPAFGSYTGGLDIQHEAFTPIMGSTQQCFLLHRGGVFPVNHASMNKKRSTK